MYNMDPYGYYVNLLWPHVLNVLVVFAYLGESVAYLRQLGALDESDPEAMLGPRWYAFIWIPSLTLPVRP